MCCIRWIKLIQIIKSKLITLKVGTWKKFSSPEYFSGVTLLKSVDNNENLRLEIP